MQRTRIDWADYSINPIRGLCPMDCKDNQGKPYCYARRMYKRFHWDETIRMEPDWAEDLPKKPSRVFVGSTMELFGDWVEEWMWDSIWQYVNDYPQHTFIFLTKQPQKLIKWSPFPDNCWVGVSATDTMEFQSGTAYLHTVNAPVKFISFEPLLDWQMGADCMAEYLKERGINWVIIGQQTPVRMATMPKLEWVSEIVKSCDNAGIPVFLKENLNCCAISDYPELLDKQGNLRQELPVEGK
jgi:protein gp37